MKKIFLTLSIMLLLAQVSLAQRSFMPVPNVHIPDSVNAGAIIQRYTNPEVPDTYSFIDAGTVGLPPAPDTSDIINVEKADVFGQIIIGPDNQIQNAP